MGLMFWKKKELAQAGKIEVSRDPAGLVMIKVSGALSPDILAAAQQKILAIGSKGPKMRGLIEADGFRGWVKGFDGGTTEVERMFEIDDITERLAVVADKEWHEQMKLFLGTWTRRAPVKFFTTQDRTAAIAWVKGS